jgi:fructokinase
VLSKSAHDKVFAGVEAGGTKFICAIGKSPDDIESVVEIPTSDPISTIRAATEFFRSFDQPGRRLAGLGIGSFGPLDLDPDSADYGHITTTPKPGWQNVDILAEFRSALDLPTVVDTDVNAAAFGEWVWGAAQGLAHFLYVTVGTGVGVGALVDGKLLHGKHHPEMGHMFVPLSANEPGSFTGICPFHQGCVEGVASGAAIAKRWSAKLCDLPADHPAHDLEADYLATFFSNLTFVLQPQKIIVGGGVMDANLLQLVREILLKKIGGYRASLGNQQAIDEYLVMPGLQDRAGVLGAIALAQRLH